MSKREVMDWAGLFFYNYKFGCDPCHAALPRGIIEIHHG